MSFFDKIFVSFYLFFKHKERSNPKFAAIALTSILQFGTLFLIIIFCQVFFQMPRLPRSLGSMTINTKVLDAILVITWISALYLRYTKERMSLLLSSYEQQTDSFRKKWKVIPFITIFGLIFVFFILAAINLHLHRK